MNDWSDTGYHEIRLEHKQLAIVFFVAVSFGVVLFLLGVWVGRKNPPLTESPTETIEQVESASPKPAEEKTSPPTFFEKRPAGERPADDSSESAAAAAPPTSTSAQAPAKPKGHVFTLQAGAFSTEENAKKAAMDLEKAGYAITVAAPDPKDKKKLYRVLVGEFASREEALAAKKRLEGMGFKNLVPK